MKKPQQEEYITIKQGCQQLRLEICGGREIKAEKDEFYRQVSAQLEELDYSELYSAYSGMIRKSQVEPRILFEILVCAYIEGVYSSRKIEQLCRNHIQFILLLDGHEPPDHCTIARFRSGKATGKAIEGLFWQYVNVLVEKGWINQDELYVDGTKIESKANRYTFVWRKTVERELEKIREKARSLLGLENGYVTRGKLAEKVEALDKEISDEGLSVPKGRGHRKPEKIRRRDEQKQLLERWDSYEQKKKILGDKRNSYSKTDPDATFMHMKDDHMRNGQLKPGYNVQFAVNSQFIVGVGVFSDRTDYATLPPMLERLREQLGFRFKRVVADSGYESLCNYRYLDQHEQEAYIKPNNYESSRTRKFKSQIGRAENMSYYASGDYYLCTNGRILSRVGTTTEHSKDGTTREVARYRCEDCSECPCRDACCKARDPSRQKELAICRELAEYRSASLKKITSEEGKLLRVNRSIQAEGAFGQLKHNRGFVRFLTAGSVKVFSELLLLAISQNIQKVIAKCNTGKLGNHILQPASLLKF